MAGLRVPLSTLRRWPYDHRRMTRGPDDWLGLSGVTLSSTTPCRFGTGALVLLPWCGGATGAPLPEAKLSPQEMCHASQEETCPCHPGPCGEAEAASQAGGPVARG